MKTIKERGKIGRYLSMLLRHKPENEGLILDKNGYTSVVDLCKKLDISKEDLDWIVDTNNKKRFAYNEDETLIRANQGHSISVDLEMKPINPPHKLYHGTAKRFWSKIQKEGLLKMSRQHVHLSDNTETARNVGKRKIKMDDEVMILQVDAKLMVFDGHKIYLSKNGVYLTDHVPPKYLTWI